MSFNAGNLVANTLREEKMPDRDNCAIVVRRPSSWKMFLRSVNVYIDGVRAGKLSNGQSVIFDVAAGTHTVDIRLQWIKTKPLEVEVGLGETVTVECQTEWSPVKMSISIRR